MIKGAYPIGILNDLGDVPSLCRLREAHHVGGGDDFDERQITVDGD